jgi:hypothetical protein
MLLHGKHPLHEPKMSNEDYKRKIKNVKFTPLNDKYNWIEVEWLKIFSTGYRR